MEPLKKIIHDWKHILLLSSIVSTLLIHPHIKSEAGAMLTYRIFMCILVAACVMVAENQKKMLISIGIIAIPAMILIGYGASETENSEENYPLFYTNMLLICSLLCLTIFSVLRDLLRCTKVTRDTLGGAISGYFLIGFLFALIYLTVCVAEHDSFANMHCKEVNILQKNIYFSFVTLTTLGYGEIHPLSDTARQVTWAEAVIGQLYIAMLVARLVALHTAVSMRKEDDKKTTE